MSRSNFQILRDMWWNNAVHYTVTKRYCSKFCAQVLEDEQLLGDPEQTTV